MNENNLENEIKEATEEVVETAAEETCQCCEQAAEEVAETAEEACPCCEQAAEEVAETAEEACPCCEQAASEAAEAIKAEAPAPVKKAAPKQAPVIKPKSGFNPTTLIAVIVAVVVIAACVVFVGYKTKWFGTAPNYKIAAHQTIQVEEPAITDEVIDSHISSFQTAYNMTDEVVTGTVEDGDTVHIQYVGTIDGVAFDGGSTGEAGTDLTIGSGSYIDGFESGLIGKKIGSTVTLDLKFPENYGNADLAGKDCQFEVTIECKKVTTTPDFTDAFVKTNSYEYTGMNYGEAVQIDTVADYREYVKKTLYDRALESNLIKAIYELVDMDATSTKEYDIIKSATANQLATYASMYGIDADTFATLYGASSAEEYCTNEADYEVKLATGFSAIAKELGIKHTDAEVDEAIQKLMDDNGYSAQYTLDEFKNVNGEGWLFMFKNFEMNSDEVLAAMKDRMVLVPAAE